MNKVTVEFLKSEIVDIEYTRLQGTLTHCTITVKNGFVFTGESACVDTANFDEEIGKKIAYENAFEKMWLPYGFWLKQTLHDKEVPETENKTFDDGMTFGHALELLKAGKRVARKGWNGKGMYLLLAESIDFETPAKMPELAGSVDGQMTLPSIVMKTADDKFIVGWLASQTDMLSNDWIAV